MTLEKSVEIMNEREHGGYDFWDIHGRYVMPGGAEGSWAVLSEFEAIAVAEKYERDNSTEQKLSQGHCPNECGPLTLTTSDRADCPKCGFVWDAEGGHHLGSTG